MRKSTNKRATGTPSEIATIAEAFNADHARHHRIVDEGYADTFHFGASAGRRLCYMSITCMDCTDTVTFDITMEHEPQAGREVQSVQTYIYATFAVPGHAITQRINVNMADPNDSLRAIHEALMEFYKATGIHPARMTLAVPLDILTESRFRLNEYDRNDVYPAERGYANAAAILGVKSVHLADAFPTSASASPLVSEPSTTSR